MTFTDFLVALADDAQNFEADESLPVNDSTLYDALMEAQKHRDECAG